MNERPILTSAPVNSYAYDGDAASSSPTYAQFLEQLSNQEFWDLAGALARPVPPSQAPSDEYLECALAHGHCILPLAVLREIVSPPYHVTRFPAAPRWQLGVTGWRGEVIAMIDLDAYLLQETTDSFSASPAGRAEGALLIAQFNHATLGLFVAGVTSTTDLPAEQIVPFEQIAARYPYRHTQSIKGVRISQGEDRPKVLVLDTDAIFTDVVQNIRLATFYE